MPDQLVLDQVASDIVSAAPPDDGGVRDVDFSTVVLVIKTLIEIYACFKQNPAKAATICSLPLVNKWFLRAAYNRCGVSIRGSLRKRMTDGFLVVGDTITAETITSIVREIES